MLKRLGARPTLFQRGRYFVEPLNHTFTSQHRRRLFDIGHWVVFYSFESLVLQRPRAVIKISVIRGVLSPLFFELVLRDIGYRLGCRAIDRRYRNFIVLTYIGHRVTVYSSPEPSSRSESSVAFCRRSATDRSALFSGCSSTTSLSAGFEFRTNSSGRVTIIGSSIFFSDHVTAMRSVRLKMMGEMLPIKNFPSLRFKGISWRW